VSASDERLLARVREQAARAVEDADLILFVVDARDGLTPEDQDIADYLRRSRRPMVLVANKVDHPSHTGAYEFYALGLGDPVELSAIHGLGTNDLLDQIVAALPEEETEVPEEPAVRAAIVGRPNVGKSSLLNAILGEERVVVDEVPGTTRDAVDTVLIRDGRRLVLVDTAGLRRKARIGEVVERYSAGRALAAIDSADVAVVVVDATQAPADQDQEIARYALEKGRACVIAVAKWDLIADTPDAAPRLLAPLRDAMRFVAYAPIVITSARKGWGIAELLERVDQAAEAHARRVATGPLNRVLEEARSMQTSLVQGKKSPEGKMDLVVGPQVAGIASHESCGHPTEADRVLGREASQAGKSFITPESIGTRVGSDLVNVVDDPTLEHAIAYYMYDDEGVRARRRYLYKEGKVHEFLHNRETASALRTRSNAASRAVNYNVEAIVRMANTFVEPKDHSLEELLEDVRFGVYMKSFMEWNIDDKRYNAKYAGRESYLVEDGEIKHPVRNTVIELTTPTFWSAVDAVGKDLEFEAGFCGKSDPGQALDASMGGPSMRLRNVYLR